MSTEVVLKKRVEFETALGNYRVSQEAKLLVADMPLVILQGISGSGRNTIIDYLVKNSNFHQIVSDTTRPPKMRDGKMEQNGVQYFFRSEDEVLNDLKAGMYLEAELIHNQQVSGINIRELRRAHESKKIPINEVARKGVSNILDVKNDTHTFFIIPPSYEEWMRRLSRRESMNNEELENRKNSARKELQEALSKSYFHYVINDSVQQAAQHIEDVVKGEGNSEEHDKAKLIAQSILDQLG